MIWLKSIFDPDYNTLTYTNIDALPEIIDSPLFYTQQTISKIIQTYSPPYTLLCSGGIDSQAMVYAWIKSKIKFNIVSFRYVDQNGAVYNNHDLDGFNEFAYAHRLKIEYRNFEYFEFLDTEYNELSKAYNCASPQITAHIKMVENLKDTTVILSGNFLTKNQELPFDYDILAVHRFRLANPQIRVVPFFFLETPELSTCFKLYTNTEMPIQGDLFDKTYEIRFKTYWQNGFPVIPTKKLSGFENIKNYFDKKTELVTSMDKLKYSSKDSKRIFDLVYRYRVRDLLGPAPKVLLKLI